MNDQEIAAYNLKLAEDTKQLIGDAILSLFHDPKFMREFSNICSWSFCDNIAEPLVSNYRFQQSLKNYLVGQLGK